jgi:tRNA modification GTPase
MNYPIKSSTICALATGGGVSAIAVIRLSGPDSFEIGDRCFRSKSGKKLNSQPGNTIHFGNFVHGDRVIDEVLVSVFKGPHSYTAEHTLEFSCHGSPFIQQEILSALYEAGAKPAKPGEFTQRAFLNGKMDLSQAEAVADLIVAENKAAHELALHQLRGGYSEEIRKLRDGLMNFAALIELELDFSTEDVEFADRAQLKTLINHILSVTTTLHESFKWGNALKNGIPVAIIGKPNAGKSTLLNALLNEDRAIVSEIPGTTRDAIEDVLVLEGTAFRFIDTAGLRETNDEIESIGIERTYARIREAEIILYLFDLNSSNATDITAELEQLRNLIKADGLLIPVGNKADKLPSYSELFERIENTVYISALTHNGLPELKKRLQDWVNKKTEGRSSHVVTNARHAEALAQAAVNLKNVLHGLELRIPGDLLAIDIRSALEGLAQITGEVSSDQLLGHIFGSFCIGK